MVTQAAKRKNQGNVQIIDYAKKRGVNKDKKPKVEEEEEVQEASMESKVKIFSLLQKYTCVECKIIVLLCDLLSVLNGIYVIIIPRVLIHPKNVLRLIITQ